MTFGLEGQSQFHKANIAITDIKAVKLCRYHYLKDLLSVFIRRTTGLIHFCHSCISCIQSSTIFYNLESSCFSRVSVGIEGELQQTGYIFFHEN